MANLPQAVPEMARLKVQLTRLYKRRLVLDEVIRLLERYAVSEVQISARKAAARTDVIRFRRTA